MGRLRHLVALAAVVLLGSSVIGLVTRDEPAPSGPATPGEVQIADFAFGPEAARVAVGSTLTWTNSDNAAHTVDSNGGILDSESIGTGATFEHTFDEPGTFTYFCAFHPFMQGSVEVAA